MPSSKSRDMAPIDHNNPIPYYHQLAEILRKEIEKGTWEVDQLIPAEGALTEMFGVSRSVTRKALDLLEGEGRVLRIKGKGTVVIEPKFSYEAVSAAARWFLKRSDAARVGRIVWSGRVMAGGHLGKLLDIAARDDVWEMILTHTMDGLPASISEIYLRIQGTLTVGAPPEFEPGGPHILQQLATKYGVEIIESQTEIAIIQASRFESETLDIPEDALVVQVNSLDFAARHRVVGFRRTVVRSDYFFFVAAVRRLNTTEGSTLSGLGSQAAHSIPDRYGS